MTIAKSALAAVFAALCLLAMSVPASAQQTTHGCACIHNNTKANAGYRYKWGDGQWQNVKLQPGYQNWICWAYDNPQKSSPNLTFQIDVDATGGQAWTTYALTRVQTAGAHCNNVGKGGHYDISYRPNTNNTFLQVTRRN
jgi:hypothetical protein